MMRGSSPLPGRVYGRLLKKWVPSLEDRYVSEAVDTFLVLSAEARGSGLGAQVAFWHREFRALLSTAFLERKALRQEARLQKAPGEDPRKRPGQQRGGPMERLLGGLIFDVRYAVRNLVRTPGFTLVALLSLTFGIAVSTVLFTVANAAFLRPLPLADEPEELVRIFSGYSRTSRGPMAYPDFLDLREATETLEDVAVARDRNFYVGTASEASGRVWGLQVSENYFDVLGIPMWRGRGFLPEDIAEGRNVAVIGHNIWQQRFAGDPGILGREILVDGRPFSVIGVGPPKMISPDSPALLEVVVPAAENREERGYQAYTAVARLRPGVTQAQAQAEVDAFSSRLAEEYPEYWTGNAHNPRGLNVLTLHQAMVPDDSTFWLAVVGFLSAVGLILLITCSNVANLLLTRAFRRREEIAVRCAIGARGRRILLQLLTENLILFVLAGVASLLLIRALLALVSGGMVLPLGANFDLDGRVVAFTFGLTLLAGFTFGLLPAVQASRPNLVPALKGRSAPMRFRRFGVRNLLVGAQVGGSAVFVMVTLLLLQSLSHVKDMDLGFEDENVAVLSMNLSHRDYGEEEGRPFLGSLRERVESMPGVEGAEIGTWIPLEGGGTYLGGIRPEGYSVGQDESVSSGMAVVSAGYHELLGIRLLKGRYLLDEDRQGGPMVVVASQAFVDRYWPGEDGLGKQILREDQSPLLVVGVVENVPMRSIGDEDSPHLWLPLGQWYQDDVVLHVRTAGDPRALLPVLRQQVSDLDPDLPVLRTDLMENVTANGTLPQRILSMIMGLAGAAALALAILGIYGVVSFSVNERNREVGLRMALGADGGRVVRMVVREGFGVALVGLVPGFLLSLAAAQLLRAFLLGAEPMDPLAFAGGFGLLTLSVVVASLAPALRAARAHPMESLRAD